MTWTWLVALSTTVAFACRSETKKQSPQPAVTKLSSVASAAPVRPEKGQRKQFELGRFEAGTEPGTLKRRPELEPALYEVQLGAFEMDVLPFPNDPNSPPKLVDSPEEAERLCAERTGRLCTELEWERACKGASSQPFISGQAFECDSLLSCRSQEGLFGLGLLKELTGSRFAAGSELAGKHVARGADADQPPEQHRCAHRDAAKGELAFRCCYGPPNGAKIDEPRQSFVFQKQTFTEERVTQLLEQHPRTNHLAKDVSLFREPDAARTVIDRGPGDRKGFNFTVSPLRWSPVKGAEFLALTGRSGENTSFVVVFYALGEDRYRLASSFVMRDEVGPVAFAYSPGIEPRFHFSTCWGCPGDTGKVLYREPDRAVILQP